METSWNQTDVIFSQHGVYAKNDWSVGFKMFYIKKSTLNNSRHKGFYIQALQVSQEIITSNYVYKNLLI